MDDVTERIIELIREATTQAEETQTKIILEFNDESNIRERLLPGTGTYIKEDRDIHVTIAVKPSE